VINLYKLILATPITIFLVLSLFLILSCGTKTYTIEEAQIDYDLVKACMGVSETITPPEIDIVSNDTVIMCGDKETNECYTSGNKTITMKVDSKVYYYRHGLVHDILFETTGDANPGGLHGHPAFAKCGGSVTILDDVD